MGSHVVVHAETLDVVLARMAGAGYTGASIRLLDDGDVAVLAAEEGDDVLVIGGIPDASKAAVLDVIGRSEVPATARFVLAASDAGVCCYSRDGSGLTRLGVTLVPRSIELFDRVRGIYETDVLRERKVAVLGLGSGGSFIARELTKAGVGSLLLLDDDRLEVGNVSRHECGLSDVGRLKVHAVRDQVLGRNPAAQVSCLPVRIQGDGFADLVTRIADFDPGVIVGATDNRESRLLVNRLGLLLDRPTMFGGVFRRAYGGQVLRVIPKLSPCYQCFVMGLPAIADDREIGSESEAEDFAYSDRPVAVEPGLSSDILPIALLIVKLTILELLRDASTTLSSLYEDLVAPLYLWVNRREEGTDYQALRPLETGIEGMTVLRWYGIELGRNRDCPACGDHMAGFIGAREPNIAHG